jgi:hypothetical protein
MRKLVVLILIALNGLLLMLAVAAQMRETASP